jgi:hypothetical protein
MGRKKKTKNQYFLSPTTYNYGREREKFKIYLSGDRSGNELRLALRAGFDPTK